MSLIKRSLSLTGHRTSISLEPEFWAELDLFLQSNKQSMASLINEIDLNRGDNPLASSVRIWVLKQAQARHKT
jgi:predicted DNA-binding ribbon-helix-helix protein